MKNNLEDYIVIQSSFLENDFCDETIIKLNESQKSKWEKHHYHKRSTDEFVSNGDKDLDILYTLEVDNTKIIMDRLWKGIANYVDSFKFPWFYNWTGYSLIRYNRYLVNHRMEKHCDHIQTLFDGKNKGVPILSCLGLLNDDYEGGEFLIFDDLKIDLKKGDLLIFPSNFLYPHRVLPVTSGIRYSYISWVW